MTIDEARLKVESLQRSEKLLFDYDDLRSYLQLWRLPVENH